MVLSPSRLAPRLPSASISPPASIFINKIMMSHLTLNFQRRSKPPACALVNDRDTNETFLNWAPIGRCKPTLPNPLLLGGDGRGVAVWQSCCAVPCCASLGCAVPCHAMPCHAVPCCAMPCHAVPCCAMSCHAVPCCAMPCHAVPCCAMPCHAVPCRAMLHHAMPCCATTGPPSKGLHCWLEGAQQVMTDIKKVKHRAFSFFTWLD